MHKIMFNDQYGLTKAVLEGRKTQTRRIISGHTYANPFATLCKGKLRVNEIHKMEEISRYSVDEILAVAQSYETIENEWLKKCPCPLVENGKIKSLNCDKCPLDRPDSCFDKYVLAKSVGWKNKLFVRPDLMPHQIRIANIRLERLRDISDEDCLKEGIKKSWWMGSSGKYLYGFGEHEDKWESPREAYAALIDRISGKGTWEKNPWVFVYDFECIKSPFFKNPV